MLCRVVAVGVLGVLLVQPASAIGFKFKVTTNDSFVLGITLFGSVQVALDAAWGKRATDLDWLVECVSSQGNNLVVARGFSAETRLEDLVFGASDTTGNGLVCTATLFKISGPATKGFLNFRATGTEMSATTAQAVRLAVDDVPGLREKIERFRAMKRRQVLRE